ncbi:MAG: Flp pilus assembly complex ATPase component TadA [Firmicutes bacterium]|nr:CpaF family protein [Alicyclobacillaceae bacterium]MCL6497889.1 Flp pilus assembly complex ATPase component TadA [Bacillota bacterium]
MVEIHWTQGAEDVGWQPGVVPPKPEAPLLSERLERWEQRLRARDPEAVAHLVWTRERLRRLEAVAEEVVREDPTVARDWVGWFRRALVNRIAGMGPLDQLLLDEDVEDLFINGPEDIYCVRGGRMVRAQLDLGDEDDLLALAQRLVARAGTVLNSEHPVADAELADGSRIHCVLPPVAAVPSITVRRRRQRRLGPEEAMAQGTFDARGWEILRQLVAQRLNLLVAGGAGAGKTSLLRMLGAVVPADERVVVIEDVRELALDRPNVVSLKADGALGLHELIVQALRMRPDRIIVGEVRGEEAFDLLEAMATGQSGSMATIHSRSGGWAVLHRLARLALRRARGFGFAEMLGQITETIDALVFLERLPTGSRRVSTVERVHREGLELVWRWNGPKEATS